MGVYNGESINHVKISWQTQTNHIFDIITFKKIKSTKNKLLDIMVLKNWKKELHTNKDNKQQWSHIAKENMEMKWIQPRKPKN